MTVGTAADVAAALRDADAVVLHISGRLAEQLGRLRGLRAQAPQTPLMLVVRNVAWCLPMIAFEWIQRERPYVLEVSKKHIAMRMAAYAVVIVLIYQFRAKINISEYYYFKF